MSSAQLAAKSIRELEEEDWKVLNALEVSIPNFESIPLRRIQKETRFHRDQLEFRLNRLNYYGFVMKTQHGYILNTAGLDVLALSHFVKNNNVSGMGRSIGMGKESDVFEVMSDSGEKAVIKFYRIGRTSFRSTRRNRAYASPENQHQWLTINMSAARREAEGLNLASQAHVNVPKFIAQNRHAVLMSEIDGPMLYRCSPEDIVNPKKLLQAILQNVRKAYTIGKMVNGDVSEYNVLFDGSKPWIIDWPQYVPLNHPNAAELLKRDVGMIVSYFSKKFGVKLDLQDAFQYVSGAIDKIKIVQT